jgi:Spy/CpxP family protein refolding chaperone
MTPKLKPWLFLSMIFVAGILTGSALTIVYSAHFLKPPGAQQMKSRWMALLTQRLNLTPDQQAKIAPILTDSDNQIQAARRDNMQTVSQIIEKTNSQIAAILTPDQQAALAKMSKEMMDRNRDRFPGHMHQWGGPHGGSGGPGGPPPPPDQH